MNGKVEIEWQQWQEVCAQLRATDAVTETDLHLPRGDRSTVGARLLETIRVWGEKYAALMNERKAGK